MKAHHVKSKDTLTKLKANSLSGGGPCVRAALYLVHFEVKTPASRILEVNLNRVQKCMS